MACLWELSGRRIFVALAMIAFLPVALELRVRNIHLLIALLTVLALRRSWVFWIPAAAMKIAPVVGPIYLLAAGRRREAALAALVGAVVLGVSVALSPGSVAATSPRWRRTARRRTPAVSCGLPYTGPADGGGPHGRSWRGDDGGRAGEVGVVVAILVANPTLWANALSLLVALVPLCVRTLPRRCRRCRDPEAPIIRRVIAPSIGAMSAAVRGWGHDVLRPSSRDSSARSRNERST